MTTHDIERRLLEVACLEFDVDPDFVESLISIEKDNERRLRRRGLFLALRSAVQDYVEEREIDTA